MKLWQYFGKYVRITTGDGQVFVGKASYYESELDNPNGVACIAIDTLEFEEHEIAKIEIVTASTQELAVAV